MRENFYIVPTSNIYEMNEQNKKQYRIYSPKNKVDCWSGYKLELPKSAHFSGIDLLLLFTVY